MSQPTETTFKGARASCRALLFCVAAGILAVTAPLPAQAGHGNQHRQERAEEGTPQQHDRSDADGAARAAEIAESRYGGTVLKVDRLGDAYSVRILLPDGTVKNVTVEAGD
jgi:hypothetical protein